MAQRIGAHRRGGPVRGLSRHHSTKLTSYPYCALPLLYRKARYNRHMIGGLIAS